MLLLRVYVRMLIGIFFQPTTLLYDSRDKLTILHHNEQDNENTQEKESSAKHGKKKQKQIANDNTNKREARQGKASKKKQAMTFAAVNPSTTAASVQSLSSLLSSSSSVTASSAARQAVAAATTAAAAVAISRRPPFPTSAGTSIASTAKRHFSNNNSKRRIIMCNTGIGSSHQLPASKSSSSSSSSLMMRSPHHHSSSKTSLLSDSSSVSSFSTTTATALSTASVSSSAEEASNNNSNNNNSNTVASRRGQQAVGLLPSYLADARAVETYHPVTAPHGALQLGVAESKLVEDWLVPKINALMTTTNNNNVFTADCIYYQPTAGRASFRAAMADYIEDLVHLKKTTNNKLDVDGLVVGAGCNAVLENLCFVLADPGDTVLIPTPYYAAFEFDLVARAGLQVFPVTTMEHSNISADTTTTTAATTTVPVEAYYPTVAALDAAYDAAPTKPKILLLSHPHNPLGIAYPPHIVQDCIDWCRNKQVHLISDEIYAGSVYRETDANFVSALELASQPTSDEGLGLGPYIHWVYALSKDFALSGLRVGVVYSENADIRLPLQKLNDMCQISSQTQVLVEGMLTAREGDDDDGNGERWTTVFRREHQARLRARGDALHALLQEFDIPHLPAACGLFCWMDLSEFLPPAGSETTTSTGGDSSNNNDNDEERERTLYLKMVQEFGLLFTPGLSMRNERPGFFRFVFSAASDEEYSLALERFRTFITSQR